MIEELLEQCAAPRELVVVSSDHRVQRAARRCGAGFADSQMWYAEMRAARRKSEADDEQDQTKRRDETSADDVAYWVDEFAGASPEEPPAGPFPPGYAEDVSDE
jgi:hypothetical protein